VLLDEQAASHCSTNKPATKSGSNPTRRGGDTFRKVFGKFKGEAVCQPARGAEQRRRVAILPREEDPRGGSLLRRRRRVDRVHPRVRRRSASSTTCSRSIHWQTAVKTHALNHPGVRHLCESSSASTRVSVPGGRLHLLLAGPECTHFSTARGGRPVNPQSRASAWHIAEMGAGALHRHDPHRERAGVPDVGPGRRERQAAQVEEGRDVPAFLEALRSLGYKVEDRRFSTPPTTAIRRRASGCSSWRAAASIRSRWPAPTHSKTGARRCSADEALDARRGVIDWNIKGKSIFNRKKPLRRRRSRASSPGSRSSAARPEAVPRHPAQPHGRPVDRRAGADAGGVGQHVGLAQPFLIEDSGRVHSVDNPLPTVTGANRGEISVVEPFVISAGGAKLRQPRSASDPLPTVMGSDRLAVVEPFVLPQHGGGVLRPASQPLPTITTDGAIAVVEPYLVQTNERRTERVDSVNDPIRTITAVGGRCFGLSQPFIVPFLGERDGQEPRVKSVDDPLQTITTRNPIGLAQPFLVPFYTERPEEKHARSRSVDDPLPTITGTGSGKLGVVEPFIVDAAHGLGGGSVERRVSSLDQPIGAVTGSNRFAVAEPFLTKYNKTATRGYSVDEPLDTVSTRDRFGVVEPFLVANNTNNVPTSLDEPIGAVTGGNRFALVQPIIDGYVLDIHFRMLQPHELAAATSFPKTYQFTGTREDIVKQIGNSWTGELSFWLNVAAIEDFAPARKRRQPWKATA
jgi:DNA (cytosine-5)-methyltransferase 1